MPLGPAGACQRMLVEQTTCSRVAAELGVAAHWLHVTEARAGDPSPPALGSLLVGVVWTPAKSLSNAERLKTYGWLPLSAIGTDENTQFYESTYFC